MLSSTGCGSCHGSLRTSHSKHHCNVKTWNKKPKQNKFLPHPHHAQKVFNALKDTVNINKHRKQDNVADMHFAQKHDEIGRESQENSGQPICCTGMLNCLCI